MIVMEPEGDPLWPTAEEGEFDVAVLYGAEAARLRLRGRSHRWERIPEWDREYGLWVDPDSRWTADPALREWIDASLDRSRLVRVVFAGAAEPPGGAGTAPGPRPLGAATRPRIELRHPAEDPRARALAAALKADLDARGFTIEIRADDRTAGGSGLRVVLLQRTASDPVANARFWVDCFGAGASDAIAVLESATRAADAASREALASHAMAVLEDDARWVPLVRVPAWLAVRHGIGSARAAGPDRIVVSADAEAVP